MKVLFIGKCSPDYQSDCIIHGFYNLLGSDFTHNKPYDLMYKDKVSKEEIRSSSGMGFTIWNNLPEYLNDNNDIENKIKNRYYSLIIYGNPYFVTSLGGSCMDYFDIVSKNYSKSEVFFIDGEDTQDIFSTFGYPLFKRELTINSNDIFPISFAIPDEKITKEKTLKNKKLADYIPDKSGTGYKFETEHEYYQNYKDSLYGITHRKSGWDCMRHYEILANYCIPYFKDINQCPNMTMVNFPKEIVKKTNMLFDTESDEVYELLDQLFLYTKNNLTTINLSRCVLDTYYKINK